MSNVIEKIVIDKYTPNNTGYAWVDMSSQKPLFKAYINGSWKSIGDDELSQEQIDEIVHKAVPVGGLTGQILAKKSELDNDVEWVNQNESITQYEQFEDKPQIGGVTLVGNKTFAQLGIQPELTFDNAPTANSDNPVKSGGVKTALDAKQDSLVSGTNIKTVNGTSILGSGNISIPKGDDAVNPFKGWYASAASLPASPSVGDYAYVKGANANDPAAIYECTTAGTWSDSGRTADTSNVQTFASGEEVNEVHIVNDLTTGGITDVLSAEQGKKLNEEKVNEIISIIDYIAVEPSELVGGFLKSNGIQSSQYSTVRFFPVENGETYRIKGRFDSNTSYYLYAFYNGENFVQAFDKYNTTDYDPNQIVEKEVVIPSSGVTHIAITYYLSSSSNIQKCYKKVINSINVVTSLFEHDSSINELLEETDNKVDISLGANILNQDTLIPDKAIPIDTVDGTPTTFNGVKLTDFITIGGNEAISANTITSANYGNAVYDKNKNFIRLFTEQTYEYDSETDDLDGFVRFSFGSAISNPRASYGYYVTKEKYSPIGGYIEDSDDDLATTECAIGSQYSYGTKESEAIASPIVNNSNDFYVGYTKRGNMRQKPVSDKIVMMNHDDGNHSDLIGTRKIYNKYGFHANFCVILFPFNTLKNAQNAILNGRKLIADGHELGLHSVMNTTYWIQNKMFDVTPNGGSTFAPSLSDFNNVVSDSKNIFNTNVSQMTTTKVRDAYSIPQFGSGSEMIALWDKYFAGDNAITQQELAIVNSYYTLYCDPFKVNGIKDCDVVDLMKISTITTMQTTRLGWLEYWYNNLIDSTLGYSSTESALADRFSEDYSVPDNAIVDDYYPDAAHILNGKMVYWGDTENPNYAIAKVKTATGFSDNDYQLVGKFTKGLFKDSFTTCNYEVIDREIAVAQAFYRKYYGLDHFTDQHFHGTTYFKWLYKNNNDNNFLNRELTVNEDMNGRFFSTRRNAFVSQRTLMAEFGINILKETQYRSRMEYEGQAGNYYGVEKIKAVGCYGGNNNSRFMTNYTDMLSMFGITTTTGQEKMSYENFESVIEGVDDWLKWCYKEGGTRESISGHNAYITTYIRTALDRVFASIGTGLVPILSFDTLFASPAIMGAVEIVLRALKKSGFEVVTFDEGIQHILSHPRTTSGNLFPNPSFKQSKWELFKKDVSITQNRVKLPDGWYGDTTCVIDVSNGVMKVTADGGAAEMITRIYGLPAGAYKLSYSAKCDAIGASIIVAPVINGTRLMDYDTPIDTYSLTDSFVNKDVNIHIPEPHQNEIDNSNPASVCCQGCEDNWCAIEVRISIPSNKDAYIKELKLYAL